MDLNEKRIPSVWCLLAPILPAFVIPTYFGISTGDLDEFVRLFTAYLIICYVAFFILSLPLYIVVYKYYKITFWSSISVGLLSIIIATLMVAIILWIFDSANSNKVLIYPLLMLCVTAPIGIVGGIFFWFLTEPETPVEHNSHDR